MPNRSKQKGDRTERKIVELHRLLGLSVQRTLLPAQAGKQDPGDLTIDLMGTPLIGEVKARKDGRGFKYLLGWLENRDILFLLVDRHDPMVVMQWAVYEQLVTYAQKGFENVSQSSTSNGPSNGPSDDGFHSEDKDRSLLGDGDDIYF